MNITKYKSIITAISLSLLLEVIGFGQTSKPDDLRELPPDQTIEREMTGAETHRYKFELKANEFFQVRAEQKGVDVLLQIKDEKGKVLAAMDSPNGKAGFETLTFVASNDGRFTLEVISPNEKAEKGSYNIKREISRTATENDKRRVEVEKLFVEGINARGLEGQTEADIAKLEKALKGWKELSDDPLIRLTAQHIGFLKNRQADVLSKANKTREALALYAEAEALFKEIGDDGQEALTVFYAFNAETTQVLNRSAEGKKLQREGTAESVIKARIIFNEVLELERNLSKKSDVVFERIGKAKESLKYTAEQVAELTAIFHDSGKFSEKNTLIDIGLTYHFFGEFDEELIYQKLALSALRQGRTGKSKEASKLFHKYDEASLLSAIGLSLGNLKKYQESIEYRRQTLQIYQELEKEFSQLINELQKDGLDKILDITSGTQSLQFQKGLNLTSIAQSYISLEQRQKAIDNFEQAIIAYDLLTDPASKAQKAQVLTEIGTEYYNLFEPGRALSYFDKALKIYNELDDKKSQADNLMLVATVYKSLGSDKKADEYYKQVLDILLKSNFEVNQHLLSPFLANQAEFLRLNQIAILYRVLRDSKKAVEYFEKSLTYAGSSKDYFKMPLSSIGSTYSSIGDIYFSEENNKPKALEYFQKAVEFSRRSQEKRSIAFELRSLGSWYLDAGNPQEALKIYNEVLAIYQSIGIDGKTVFSSHYATTLNYLAKIHDKLGNRQLAIFYGKLCVNAIQSERQHLQSFEKDLQKNFIEKNQKPYRGLADRLIAEGNFHEAEKVLQMLKEDEYFDYVRRDAGEIKKLSVRTDLRSDEQAALMKYEQFAEKVTEYGIQFSELEELKNKQGADFEQQAEYDDLNVKLTAANTAFRLFLDKELVAEFSNRTKIDDKIEINKDRALQTKLQQWGKGTVALYTVAGDDRYRVILTTPKTQTDGKYEIKIADLNKKIFEFRAALQNPAVDPRPLGKELYDILIKPIEKDLQAAEAKTLLWSLDGTLRYIPFAALSPDGVHYLAEKYQNVVITSTTRQSLLAETDPHWRLLGAGVTKASKLTEPNGSAEITFSALPEVKNELLKIVSNEDAKPKETGLLSGIRLIDEGFDLSSLENGMTQRTGGKPKYNVIHLATHFRLGGDTAKSFLLMGNNQALTLEKVSDDTLLNFGDVELVTLSACNTGFGTALENKATSKEQERKQLEANNGAEVDSLATFIELRGAKAVLASLWSVADESTQMLMSEFYRLRKENPQMTKAEAMQQAQRSMIEGKLKSSGKQTGCRSEIINLDGTQQTAFKCDTNAPFAHPYFWSPFVLIGNWR